MITIAIVMFFYLVVLYRKPGKNRYKLHVAIYSLTVLKLAFIEVNWGSSTQAQTYRAALTSIQQLVHIEEHVKNYRPQILLLTGLPSSRPALVDFAYLICKNNSLMICGNIVQVIFNCYNFLLWVIRLCSPNQQEKLPFEMRCKLQQKAYRYLRFTNIKGFCSVADNSNLNEGVASMLCLSGVGKVKPNILMMGYKSDWSNCNRNLLDQYVLTIK